MPFFCISDHPQLPIIRVLIHKKMPKPIDKEGFRLRYTTTDLPETAVQGAQLAIEALDESMGPRTKAPGMYQAKYDEVRRAYQAILDKAPKPRGRPILLRIAAGLLAIALMFAMGFCLTGGIIIWMVVCAFKHQSGLLTMAETAIVWRILDWSPTIRFFGRYALGK